MTAQQSINLSHAGGFEALNEHYDYWIRPEQIKGQIPESVRGTFFRIGPGRNRIGGEKYGHWFDGDGMLHALTFSDTGVHYKNRYVETPKYLSETEHQRITHRSFGHNAPGGPLKNIGRPPANCANTSMIYHGGKLLALWEGGRPWQLDPYTLDTIGEYNYDGKLNLVNPFSAHGKVNPFNGCYYNFGMRPWIDGKSGDIMLYKVSPTGHVVKKGHIKTDFFCFCHDFGLTEHYAVFFTSPIVIQQPLKLALGLAAFDDLLAYEPKLGMKAYVVRLKDFKLVKTFKLSPFVAIHYSNCWEENDELVVDLTRFEDFSVNEALKDVFHRSAPGGELWRYRLNLATGAVQHEPFETAHPCEFPQWDPRKTTAATRYIYTAVTLDNGYGDFFNALQRIDTHTGKINLHDFGPGRYTSEAMFVPESPNGPEEKGHLVVVIYNAQEHKSEAVVLDAQTLKEVAVVPLNNHVPFGFHCGWSPERFLINEGGRD